MSKKGKKKVHLYRYDNKIYPLILWVYCGADIDIVLKHFSDDQMREVYFDGDHSTNAMAFSNIVNKDSGENSILLYFKDDIPDIPIIAHECMHFVDRTMEFIGEEEPGKEQKAYLIEWAVKSCLDVVEENKKIKKKELDLINK